MTSIDLLTLLGLTGATLIVVRGTVLEPLRRLLPSLLRCAQCTGWWFGAVAAATGVVDAGRGRLLDAIVVGAAVSFLAMLSDAVLLNLLGDPEEKDT